MIEKCTLADVDALMADLRNMYVEMAPFGKMDEEKCISFLTDSIQHHIVLKKTEEEKLLGHMGLRAESHWYTNDAALYEYYVYVHPEHRKTRTAFELYKVAKSVAQSVKLPFFYGTFRKPESDFERVNKFLKRQGGQQVGSQFFIGAT
jgi:GNAT superfamily N-acetyltransferase